MLNITEHKHVKFLYKIFIYQIDLVAVVYRYRIIVLYDKYKYQ
jgi:hypothetical protein